MAIDAAVSTTTNGHSNGHSNGKMVYSAPAPSTSTPTLLDTFMASQDAVQAHK